MDKSQLNRILKELGVDFITARVSGFVRVPVSKSKGIKGASEPLDSFCTSELPGNALVEKHVDKVLRPHSCNVAKVDNCTTYEVLLDSGVSRKLSFSWKVFDSQAYNKKRHVTYWYVLAVQDT